MNLLEARLRHHKNRLDADSAIRAHCTEQKLIRLAEEIEGAQTPLREHAGSARLAANAARMNTAAIGRNVNTKCPGLRKKPPGKIKFQKDAPQ
jgi:hypothetical protein